MTEKKISRRNFIKSSAAGAATAAFIPTILKSTPSFASKSNDSTEMFCYQCEQTMMGKGCTKIGVCGKTPEVAALQDLLIYSLKGLSVCAVSARKAGIVDIETNRFTTNALFSTLTNVDFDPARFEDLLEETVSRRESLKKMIAAKGGSISESSDAVDLKLKGTIKGLVSQGKKVGLKSDTEMNPDIQSLQHILLFGLKGLGAYTHHAYELGQEDDKIYEFVHRALAIQLDKNVDMNTYLGLVLECGEKNLRAMELLDAGNTGTYGHPIPTKVPLGAIPFSGTINDSPSISSNIKY